LVYGTSCQRSSLLVGNFVLRLAGAQAGQGTGRTDVCALPYASIPLLNSLCISGAFAGQICGDEIGVNRPMKARIWLAGGLVACFGSGMIELFGAADCRTDPQSHAPRRIAFPLAGIALGLYFTSILLSELCASCGGFATLAIVLMVYFGKVKI